MSKRQNTVVATSVAKAKAKVTCVLCMRNRDFVVYMDPRDEDKAIEMRSSDLRLKAAKLNYIVVTLPDVEALATGIVIARNKK